MTTKIAAIYDIHGNLPALAAVLDEINNANVDLILVGGDVLPGPFPAESLQRLLDCEIPIQWISGNGESCLLSMLNGESEPVLPQPVIDAIRWS